MSSCLHPMSRQQRAHKEQRATRTLCNTCMTFCNRHSRYRRHPLGIKVHCLHQRLHPNVKEHQTAPRITQMYPPPTIFAHYTTPCLCLPSTICNFRLFDFSTLSVDACESHNPTVPNQCMLYPKCYSCTSTYSLSASTTLGSLQAW